MDTLTWAGGIGAFVNPALSLAVLVFVLGFVANLAMTIAGM